MTSGALRAQGISVGLVAQGAVLRAQGISAGFVSKQTLAAVGVYHPRHGVTITGYTALFCFSALCTLLVLGATHAFRRWRGLADRGYVQVVKSGDV